MGYVGSTTRCSSLAVSPYKLERAADGLTQLIALTHQWAIWGRTVLTEMLRGEPTPKAWQHWPNDDAYDRQTGFRWFYHAHASGGRTRGEHGHFHLFADTHEAERVTHLVAVSVDARGLPCGLFAPNRWVTDEHWSSAAFVIERLAAFELRAPDVLRPVHQWLAWLVGAFGPQIEAVLHARDERLAELRLRLRSDVPEDRRIAVLSRCPISLSTQAHHLDGWRGPRLT